MGNKVSHLKAAWSAFRHYLRWPHTTLRPVVFDDFCHEHTCLVAKLTNVELADACPLSKNDRTFYIGGEDDCEKCKYFCRIDYEKNPKNGEKQIRIWANDEFISHVD